MQYRRYGKTGKQVSQVGFGTSRLSGDASSFRSNVDLIHKAIDLGVNYFDTAPTYASGASERILGTAFRDIPREKFYVASKSMLSVDPTADDVLRRIESTTKTLNVEKIDFFHMWSVLNLEQYFKIIAPGGPYEGALKAKEQGLIDHICFSAHCSGNEISKIVSDGRFDGVTLGFNALNYRHRLQGLQFSASLGLGIAIMNPLAGGLIPKNPEYFQHLKRSADDNVACGALRFVASHPEVSTVLIGVNSERDLLEAVRSIEQNDGMSSLEWRQIANQLMPPDENLCTMCNYCDGCPAGISVRDLMASYNEYILSKKNATHFHEWRKMFSNTYPFEMVPCIGCGRCESKCTQHLPIISRIKEINSICGKEADIQRKLCETYFPQSGYPVTGIYGLSINAETILKAYQTFYGKLPERVHFFDSNPAKWSSKVLDTEKNVHPPQDIALLGVKRIIIAPRKYEQEIRAFLENYVTEETIIDAL